MPNMKLLLERRASERASGIHGARKAAVCRPQGPAPPSKVPLRITATSATGALSHTGIESPFASAARQAFLVTQRNRHPGPTRTYLGTAQALGLLKERSEDVFLAELELPVDPEVCTSIGSDSSSDEALEAAATTVIAASGLPSLVVTGVFDGHGGNQAARFAQESILSMVSSDRELQLSLGLGDAEATSSALKSAYCKVDDAILGAQGCRDGTTALLAVQLGGQLAVANAGDSRAVLCRGGEAVRLSRDHTPDLRAERQRIEAAGGQVVVARGAPRVIVPCGGVLKALAVSRSLGDPDFKANGLVIAEPDVTLYSLQPGVDAFLIAASDGLWGRVEDQDAVDAVQKALASYAHLSGDKHRSAAATAAARALLRLAQDSGSTDDITAVVTVFSWDAQQAAAAQ